MYTVTDRRPVQNGVLDRRLVRTSSPLRRVSNVGNRELLRKERCVKLAVLPLLNVLVTTRT